MLTYSSSSFRPLSRQTHLLRSSRKLLCSPQYRTHMEGHPRRRDSQDDGCECSTSFLPRTIMGLTILIPPALAFPQTMLEIVDAMDAFGIVRTEPTLVIGGGLVTDVTGYACASYRRSSNFIRVPTTLIGLIDASVSIKVGINHRKLKNR